MNFLDSVFVKAGKNRIQEILTLCYFLNHFCPMSGTVFIQTTKNDKFSLYLFLTFSSTRVLETHLVLGGLKAARIDPALSKFCLSVGDGATCLTSSCPLGPLLFRDILSSVVSYPWLLEADNWLCCWMSVIERSASSGTCNLPIKPP